MAEIHYSGAATLTNIEHLTAFADYRVPQTLCALGYLKYSPKLSAILSNPLHILPPGSRLECEVRAATLLCVRELRERIFEKLGFVVPDALVDFALWELAQRLRRDGALGVPMHRTPGWCY